MTKRLLEPHLDTMANGQVCLRLAAETTWAEFDQVAPLVFRALNATLGEKLDGVDVRSWERSYRRWPKRGRHRRIAPWFREVTAAAGD